MCFSEDTRKRREQVMLAILFTTFVVNFRATRYFQRSAPLPLGIATIKDQDLDREATTTTTTIQKKLSPSFNSDKTELVGLDRNMTFVETYNDMEIEEAVIDISNVTDWQQFTLNHPRQAIWLLENLTNYEHDKEKTGSDILNENPNATTIREIATSLASMEEYPWNDIDFVNGTNDSLCGIYKCLWYSLSSNATFGYLMTRKYKKDVLKYVEGESYRIEQYLFENYGILQQSLELPQRQNVSYAMFTALNVYGQFKKLRRSISFPLYIQRVTLIPEPTLAIGVTNHKSQRMKQALPAFAEMLQHDNVTSIQAFKSTFRKQVQQVVNYIQDEPDDAKDSQPYHYKAWHILHDFQIRLDLKGQWYHLDLDRMTKATNWPLSKSSFNDTATMLANTPNLQRRTPPSGKTVEELIEIFEYRMKRLLYWLTKGHKVNYRGLEEEVFCLRGWHCR